ncbi:MAG TPA: TldD/PmbA family protein [Gemmatimonadaceae bacterium]|nr:TldD/PmbA family protein [Gemmatimonadaceae bacterium]
MSSPRRLIRAPGEQGPLSREESQKIISRVAELSKADAVQVQLGSNHSSNTRFAANQMSTSGSIFDVTLAVQSSFGKKHAVVVTNDLSDESVRQVVTQSEALAKLAPEDPEAMPPLGPQQYATVPAYFESTASLSASDMARAAMTALEPARAAKDLQVAGFIVTSAGSNAIGNDKGLFAYHRSTSANYTLTVRTADGSGSGWAGADHPDWSRIDFEAVSKRALEKARASRGPVAIEPGRYTVILEPQAVGDLVQLMGGYADARSADEGRSPFAKQGGGNKIGEKIVDERVTILSDPSDAQLLSQPFDGEGFPLGQQIWIERGVLKKLFYSRFWAKKKNETATGAPQSIKLQGGSSSLDDMIAATERGVLVTRLWYLREVDPRTILYTGLTRDGTFLVENGKITKAIRNFRFNESPLFMLNNLEMLGRAERLAGTEAGGDIVMPAIKVRDFNFTSLSEAV